MRVKPRRGPSTLLPLLVGHVSVEANGRRPGGRPATVTHGLGATREEHPMNSHVIDSQPAAWSDAPDLIRNERLTSADAKTWGAVGSMAMCVALLIAAEFMPVSLLTPGPAHLILGISAQNS